MTERFDFARRLAEIQNQMRWLVSTITIRTKAADRMLRNLEDRPFPTSDRGRDIPVAAANNAPGGEDLGRPEAVSRMASATATNLDKHERFMA
jgi:hypothetical protein